MIFHFEVRTETHVLLTDAASLADLNEARVEAARRVGEVLREHAALLWVDEEWRMDVTDGEGLILFVIMISAMQSAATSHLPRLNR